MIALLSPVMMVETSRFGNRPAREQYAGNEPRAGNAAQGTIQSVFVYGTLQRGQCREGLWPAVPSRVEPAWTRGALYHRADYPAMTAGADRVLGQRWEFPPAVLDRVIAVLDQIEGANQPGQPDLYRRVAVELLSLQGQPLGAAFGYHYAADPAGDGFQRLVPPTAGDFVQWP